jgi:DNA topoisomerase IA
LTVVEVRLVEGETKPPPRLDEAELELIKSQRT